MLTLTSEDLKELDKFIMDLPTKYGMPLINFINSKISEQTKQEPVEQVTESV
jgi:predicted secreted protein